MFIRVFELIILLIMIVIIFSFGKPSDNVIKSYKEVIKLLKR